MTKPSAAFRALLALARAPAASVSLAYLRRRYGDVDRVLLDARYLERTGDLRSIVCAAGDEPHVAELEFDERARRWGHYCLAIGEWVEADEAQITAVRIAPSGIVRGVASALAPLDGVVQERELGVLWLLGVAVTERVKWTAMIAFGIDDQGAFDRVAQRLPHVSKIPGLVLSLSPVSAQMPPIGGHRFSPLADHLRMRPDGGFELSAATLLPLLGRKATTRGVPGRPSAKSQVEQIVLNLSETEARLPKRLLVPLIRQALRSDAPRISDWTLWEHAKAALKGRWEKGET